MSSRPQKLGILISSVESPWKSCNSISPNLVQSYTLLERDPAFQVEWLRVCPRSEAKDLRIGTGFYLELAGKIYAGGTTDLIFLDHHIDPLPLLLALKTLSIRQFRKLRFSIHIYGDFTLVPERWIEIGKILEGTQTKLICASERQKRMVSFFEPTGPSATSVCPFPVNTKMFAFSTKFRAQIRKRLGVGDKQTLLLYTGRISLQKCVLRLIEEFHQLCTEGRGDLYLAIAGPIDDLGGMTSDIKIPKGFFFHKLQEKLQELPKRVRERIFILGDLESGELKKIYSAADLFVSISLHHDEDFGMCPAEALASGLPSILTDWGGYASFKGPKIPCELVPVNLGRRGLEIDSTELAKLLRAGLTKLSDATTRRRDGVEFAKIFGIAAIARKLKEELKVENFPTASGFDWSLEMVNSAGSITGELYKDVYGQYVQQPTH